LFDYQLVLKKKLYLSLLQFSEAFPLVELDITLVGYLLSVAIQAVVCLALEEQKNRLMPEVRVLT